MKKRKYDFHICMKQLKVNCSSIFNLYVLFNAKK